MHEFIISGELVSQTKRLLRYRLALILVIILNILVIAHVPMPPSEAQALGPDVSLAPSNGLVVKKPQTDPPVIANFAHDIGGATPIFALPTNEGAWPIKYPLFHSPFGSDTNRVAANSFVVPAYPMPLTTDAPDGGYGPSTFQPTVAPKTAAAETFAAALDNLSSIPLDQWQRNAEQLAVRWQHSAHNVMQRFNESWNNDSWNSDTGNSKSPGPTSADAPVDRSSIASDVDPAETWRDAGLVIRNPLANEETVRFLVNSRVCELRPGEAHWFAPEAQWLIQFHRGGEFGDVDRVVRMGAYQFSATPQGWDLRPVKP